MYYIAIFGTIFLRLIFHSFLPLSLLLPLSYHINIENLSVSCVKSRPFISRVKSVPVWFLVEKCIQFRPPRNELKKVIEKSFNPSGSGLKILTTQQMLARLPILLAQIKTGNNSLELKNEIRQLFYSLYKSKQISKTVYKNLIATI